MDSRPLRVFFYTVEPVHGFYRQQFLNPPGGVEYVPSSPMLREKPESEELSPWRTGRLEKMALRAFDPFALLKTPLVRPTFVQDVDLIHSGQVLMIANKPWVIDFEQATVFGRYSPKRCRTKHFRFLLKKILAMKQCRKLMPWTRAAQESMKNLLGREYWNELSGKTEVVYPTITRKPFSVKKDRSAVKLLFVGKFFYQKGGLETILAFLEAGKKIDAELTMVSKIPAEVKERFGRTEGLSLLEAGSAITNKEVERLYCEADVFVYPTHMDNFGYVIFEAMSHSLPVIATNQYAVPELIDDGKTGLLISNPYSDHGADFVKAFEPSTDETHPLIERMKNPPKAYVKELAATFESLAASKSARQRMGREAWKSVSTGKFSPEARSKQLKRIYGEACL